MNKYIITAVAVLVFVLAILLTIKSFFPEWISGLEKGKDGLRDNRRDIDKNNITLSDAKLSSMADIMYKAMDGPRTDENAVYSQLSLLNTADDWKALKDAFGTRTNHGSWIYKDYDGTLEMFFTDEFSSKEKEIIQNYLSEIDVNLFMNIDS